MLVLTKALARATQPRRSSMRTHVQQESEDICIAVCGDTLRRGVSRHATPAATSLCASIRASGLMEGYMRGAVHGES